MPLRRAMARTFVPNKTMIDHFVHALPLVGLIAIACAFLGWSMHGVASKPAPAKSGKPAPTSDKAQPDRAKNLEATLEKSKAAHKALKSEFEALQANTVPKETLASSAAELAAVRTEQESSARRMAALETDLKKSQETIRSLNARTNDGDKAQKARTFSLENELSKAREQLAQLQDRPDDSSALQTEIDRLRESVATTTRFAGEVRKREAAALEALEKAEARVAELAGGNNAPVRTKKIGPVGESSRIAAAKAEVLRLLEQNKRRDLAAPHLQAPELEIPVEAQPEAPVVLESEAADSNPPEVIAQVEAEIPTQAADPSETESPAQAYEAFEEFEQTERPHDQASETPANNI